MRRGLLAAGILLLLAAGARTEEGKAPVSAEALHFRIEIGEGPARTILGFIDESRGTGKGYDLCVLDLDGDGVPETRREIERRVNPRTGRPMPNTEILLSHGGAEWTLDLYSVGYRRSLPRERRSEYPDFFRWSVTKGDFHARFINGRAQLYDSAAEAAEGKAIRLGPPFRFEVSTRSRGPELLVSIGLEDGNGGTLREARLGDTLRLPELRLLRDGKEELSTRAEYG